MYRTVVNFRLDVKEKYNSLFTTEFTRNDNEKSIKSLDPNHAHGNDMISSYMLKICGNSISKPLQLMFRSCIKNGEFRFEWKKVSVVPMHKKSYKQTLKNYRPISLLPICRKVFEQLIYNKMHEFYWK